jgi:hypothetical protein
MAGGRGHGGYPPRTASTGRHARRRYASPFCGTGGACRRRRSSPSRTALSTAHRVSLAGTSWASPSAARGAWLVSSRATRGALAGQPVSRAKDRLAALTKDGKTAPPGGEPHQAFLQRFLHTFTQIGKQAKAVGVPVAIVTHASGVRAIYSLLTRGRVDPSMSDGMAKAEDPVPPGGFVTLTPSGTGWRWGKVATTWRPRRRRALKT